jgi:tRNA (uracil-5-)-methyltransferase TRM9
MQDAIISRLLSLNQEFYQTFGDSFAETRSRLQPGALRVLEGTPQDASVLDLGCGTGGVARRLAALGHGAAYIGLDSSAVLLSHAQAASDHPQAEFHQADLTDPAWTQRLPSRFDRVFAFAMLHHIPGERLRSGLLRQIHTVLEEDGQFVLSVWNFTASPRLKARVLPWDTIGLDSNAVEPGDYLLDWRRDGHGIRYVHLFDEDQLARLAAATGFRVEKVWYSDGEGGRLGLYALWQPEPSPGGDD